MNTDLLQRVTFVLDRATADRLAAIASRLGVSRSALARDVLSEPVELMHRWLQQLPEDATAEQGSAVLAQVGRDVEAYIDAKSAQLDLLRVPADGHA